MAFFCLLWGSKMHLLGAWVSSDSENRGLSIESSTRFSAPSGSVDGRCLTTYTFPKYCLGWPGQGGTQHRPGVCKRAGILWGYLDAPERSNRQTQVEQQGSLPQHVSKDRNYTKIGEQWDKSQIFDFTSQDSFLSPPLVTKPLVHTPTPSSKKQLGETNVIALKYTEQ